MAHNGSRDPIKKVVLKDGTARYRFVIDVGKTPDGRRDQRTYTFAKLTEARQERAKIIAARADGKLVKRSKMTVREACEAWLMGKVKIKDSTRRTYRDALALICGKVGHVPLQELTKATVDQALTELQATGRRVGNRQSRQLSGRYINLVRTQLTAVLHDAEKQGLVGRNVAALVEPRTHVKPKLSVWTADQAAKFLAHTAGDRLAAAWALTLYGLRRGEVLGLRWEDVDLVAGTLTVRWTRGLAGTVVVEGVPKTATSVRTLPLDADLSAALVALQLRQREEAERAGEAYQACPLCAGHHVVANELGLPYSPSWFSDRFTVLATAAGVPRIRLHDARHTTASLLAARKVPPAAMAAWLGHSKASFTMDVYVHSDPAQLADAASVLRTALTSAETVAA